MLFMINGERLLFKGFAEKGDCNAAPVAEEGVIEPGIEPGVVTGWCKDWSAVEGSKSLRSGGRGAES